MIQLMLFLSSHIEHCLLLHHSLARQHIPIAGNRHSIPPRTSCSSLPNDGAYQAIIRNEATPDTTYAGLNDITRERSISVSATASRQDQEQYMQLNQATRNTKDSLYMGVGRSH